MQLKGRAGFLFLVLASLFCLIKLFLLDNSKEKYIKHTRILVKSANTGKCPFMRKLRQH